MTEDTDPTSADHLKASVKKALGKITGDAQFEAEGRRQKRRAGAPEGGAKSLADKVVRKR